MVQLSTSYVKKFANDNLTNREKTDMKGEDLSFPFVKKIFTENRLLKDIEFDILTIDNYFHIYCAELAVAGAARVRLTKIIRTISQTSLKFHFF